MFDLIWIPVVIIGGLGLIFGLVLSIASKKFEVKVDERIEKVRELLPGANCAACGHTGCDGFAEAVVEGKAGVSGCPASGAETAAKIAEILGVEAEEVERKIARVMCGGTYDTCRTKFDYSGIRDCAAIEPFYGGPRPAHMAVLEWVIVLRHAHLGLWLLKTGLQRLLPQSAPAVGNVWKPALKRLLNWCRFAWNIR